MKKLSKTTKVIRARTYIGLALILVGYAWMTLIEAGAIYQTWEAMRLYSVGLRPMMEPLPYSPQTRALPLYLAQALPLLMGMYLVISAVNPRWRLVRLAVRAYRKTRNLIELSMSDPNSDGTETD